MAAIPQADLNRNRKECFVQMMIQADMRILEKACQRPLLSTVELHGFARSQG